MTGAAEGLGGFVAERAILRVAGEEARDWLQGLVTNDVARLGPGAPVYAALLTPQGKYLFDFFLVDPGDGAVLIDVAADRAADLLKRLSLYRIRRKVTVEDVSEAWGVALVWGDGLPTPAAPAFAVADPRAAALGWRIYAPDAAAALAAMGAAEAPRAAYDALRVACAAPETGVELVPDDTFILEAGFDRLHGVDFRKGCYVGQEVTARMRHKTELKKGLVRVAVEGDAPPPGTPAQTPEGKPAGVLFTVAGGEGLAHLRFDRAEGAMAGGARLRPLG
jgi:folate-binding protein YgfZ